MCPTMYEVPNFTAIPQNISSWGSESWDLTRQDEIKISVFHHPSIRPILKTNMLAIQALRITNKDSRSHFFNIQDIGEFILRRQL
mmetsp:Transcript_50272/g.151354  ORF Transcript_50272/g.151354 Transcript_50272/m.151354 type:complete len:85 (+) Transcript_50272:1197-1451(+)